MVLFGCASGANATKFAVCHVTLPVVLVCVGWDEATVIWHPMGKCVGDNRSVVVLVVRVCNVVVWSSAVMHLVLSLLLLCVQSDWQKACCIVVAALWVQSRSRMNWGGGKKTHSILDSEVPCPMCISSPNCAK
jgi:hypothetical protein